MTILIRKSWLASAIVAGALLCRTDEARSVVVGTVPVAADPHDLHVGTLMNGFRLYADAASRRFVSEANLGILPPTQERWNDLHDRLLDATFVTLLYTYEGADGVARSRTYYAISSERRGPSSVASSSLPDPVLSGDIAEYLDPSPGEVVASLHEDGATRVIWKTPTTRSDIQDAEIKAVRSLEHDLRTGVVREHGTATVFISRPSCLPCSQAMAQLANEYPISVIARELVLPSPGVSSGPFMAFRSRREAFMSTVRHSLGAWATFRPVDAPPSMRQPEQMCVVGQPVRISPVSLSSTTPWEPGAAANLIRAYALKGKAARYQLDFSDSGYASWILLDQRSPYSGRDDRTLRAETDTERLARELMSSSVQVFTQRSLHDRKVFELGYTKSRAGRDVTLSGPSIVHDRGMAARVKTRVAGPFIDASRHAIGGARFPAISAIYAVALQALADKKARVTKGPLTLAGVHTDISDNAAGTPGHWNPGVHDLDYLAMTIDGLMNDWRDLPGSSTRPVMPALFRVARLAAAFRDEGSYVVDPCLPSGQHDPAHAGRGGRDPRPLCFDDATDRAVYQWFVAELHREMLFADSEEGLPQISRYTAPLRNTIFGRDTMGRDQLATAYLKEVIDMHIVNNLVVRGFMTGEAAQPVLERATKLIQEGAP